MSFKFDPTKYNTTIHESYMLEEYAFDIQKRFDRKLPGFIENDLKDDPDAKFNAQGIVDLYKNVIFFEITEIYENNIYRGMLVKTGGSTIRELGKQYYFIGHKKLSLRELYSCFDNIDIHENKEDIKIPVINNVKSTYENPLTDVKDEFDIPPVQPSDNNELINIVNLVFELYKLDPTHLKKALKDLNVNMKMYSSLYDNSNRTTILKALSFYDHMRSNKKIQVIEHDKARQTHKESLNRSSDHYEIDPNELQTWIGRRNGFAGKKF